MKDEKTEAWVDKLRHSLTDFDAWIKEASEHEREHLVSLYHALNLHRALTEKKQTETSGILSNLTVTAPMVEQYIPSGTRYFLVTATKNTSGFTMTQNGVPLSVLAGVTTPVMIPAISEKGQWIITDTDEDTYQVLAFSDIPAPQGVTSVVSVGVGSKSTLPSYATLVSSTVTSVLSGTDVYTLPSTTETVGSTSANLSVGSLRELALDINVTAISGTTPTLNAYLDRLGSDGEWYTIWSGAQITAVGTQSTSIGAGLADNASFGSTCRFRYVIGGTTPSVTFSVSIQGK